MSNADILKTFIEFTLAVLVVVLFINEKKLIAFERRIGEKVKRYFNPGGIDNDKFKTDP